MRLRLDYTSVTATDLSSGGHQPPRAHPARRGAPARNERDLAPIQCPANIHSRVVAQLLIVERPRGRRLAAH